MNMPLDVTFHGIPTSPALRDAIAERVSRLERFAPDAISCRVTVEYESRRRHQGRIYRVHARLVLPSGEYNVGRSSPIVSAHEDPYIAVRDTFDALRRRLDSHDRRRPSNVEHHAEPTRGRILELFPDTGYGVIESETGRTVHFHRNSLLGNAEDLEIGREVSFTELSGDDGPWAGSLRVIDVEERAETT